MLNTVLKLLYAWFTCSKTTNVCRKHHYPQFIDDETETWGLSELLNVTQLENQEWSWSALTPKPNSESLCNVAMASTVTQPEWGQSCNSDYMWGSGSRLLWDTRFHSFQHWLGQVERCTYAQGRLRFNIALCWFLGRCLFKGSGNRCVGSDSITWWRGTHWSMAIFKERCWLC